MGTAARFSDGQYKNWLKCSQSLIIMKEALHDYIDNEVKKLHGDITKKVHSIPCGSSTGDQCGSCSWKDIKPTGVNPGNWFVNCRICDKWLTKILHFHEDPHNPNINWKNADIRKWPSDCYHVAKIFMPKGQGKTRRMPEDLDTPAILSLLIYCKWFRKDLPNTQILYDLINIRNDVLHSGDLRVTDGNKDRYINKMIQFLSDLKIHVRGDVQTELQKLKIDDIDIKFRETESSVFQNMVSCLQSDLTTMKEDVSLVQNRQSQLSEEVKDLRDNTTETNGNVKILEAEIEQMRKSVNEFRNMSDKLVSFFDKNPDIADTKIIETIRIIGTDVKNHQNYLSKVETEQMPKEPEKKLKGVKRKFEEQKGEGKRSKQLRRNQTKTASNRGLKRGKRKHEEQIENDEQLSLPKDISETPKKKRPETDGLRQLKYQTEDKLDTLRCLKCIQTKQAEEAKKLLKRKRLIVIRGNPGEGKTTTALYLIDNEMYNDKRVLLYSSQDWMKVDTEWVNIVVLEDIFGKFDLDSDRLQEWNVHLPTIKEHVDAGKLQVIITTREDVLSKAYSELGSLKLFSDDLTLTLSSNLLSYSVKISILNRELQRHKKNMKEDEKEKCIANFSGSVGFPQCCLLFARDSTLFDRGPDFFRSPSTFFVENIAELEATRFLSLAFLFCSGEILEENLSAETMPETSNNLLAELASNLRILEKNATITLLRDAYDSFFELYVVKSMSYDISLESPKHCIQFTHATVCEAVGQVLGVRCPEMVVKYGDSEYLYHRTYTAKAKDGNSKNTFIPVSLYGLLAERMVHDVVKRSLIQSVVKHSSLKQHDYLKKLKSELQKGNGIKEFFLSGDRSLGDICTYRNDMSEGKCKTFMQYILQCDEELVRLVYSEFLEFLECAHKKNSSICWKCTQKQELLELSLIYHHFEIADKLITMNACYTHVSLRNAAKHGDLVKVQTILEVLKRSRVFKPGCNDAKIAFCTACISGNQDLIEFMIQEGIITDIGQVVDSVRYGDVSVLKKVVEHLKSRNEWNPHWEPYSTHWEFGRLCLQFQTPVTIFRKRNENYIPYSAALFLTYHNQKFDIADYLLKNDVKPLLSMLHTLTENSSQNAVARAIEDLKYIGNWDPKCNSASEALEIAFRKKKYDVCNLLLQEGVSLAIKILPDIVNSPLSEYSQKTIQNMKDAGNWDPKCDDALKALEIAYRQAKYDVCDLLIQEGVPVTMKNFPCLVYKFEHIKNAVQTFKDTDNWDPKCHDARKALKYTYLKGKYDVCDLLVQEGVSLTMEDLSSMVNKASLESIKKAIQNLKDGVNWDPKCDDASKTLQIAYCKDMYDMCDLLIQEGISLTMKFLLGILDTESKASFESIKKAIMNLKDSGNWDPKCDDAFEALEMAYREGETAAGDLLVQEGISLTMKILINIVCFSSLESIKKAIQNIKNSGNWDPKCHDALEALHLACSGEDEKTCDLLIQEGISITMTDLPMLACIESFETIKKAIQNMKDTGNWDPECYEASITLANVCMYNKDDVYDLLAQEGILLTMKNLPLVVSICSFESIKKAIKNLKDTGNWDPTCDSAFEALNKTCKEEMYHVCNLLLQEGVSLTMKNLPDMVYSVSVESIKNAIQHLKYKGNWDPDGDDAFKALENSFSKMRYDVCDLLVQKGISFTMKHLPNLVSSGSFESIKKAIQNMKDTGNWDPDGDDAFKALENSLSEKRYGVCDLLVQNGISFRMKHLPSLVSSESFESIKKAIQNMKDTGNWDPDGGDAFKALENAYSQKRYDVCDLLVQKGMSLTMKHIYSLVSSGSFESIKKAIQNMKDTGNWDPDGGDAFKALENAYSQKRYDVCDLLVQKGISLTMKFLSSVVSSGSFVYIERTIHHLIKIEHWDPECDDAYEALLNAYRQHKYDVCDLLVQKGISLTMKHLSSLLSSGSLESIKKAIQNMKDTGSWDPKCEDASKALETAYHCFWMHDVYDLLFQEGLSFTMKNLPSVVSSSSSVSIKKAIQNMKDTGNWDPKCDDASKELTNDCKYCLIPDLHDLLFQRGHSFTMKHLPHLVSSGSFESIKKAIQNMKDTGSWDPKCEDASKALKTTYYHRIWWRDDLCDLLFQEGISFTMKHLPNVVSRGSFEAIKKAIQNMKDTGSWDPKCEDASKALETANYHHIWWRDDLCDLLFQEGISFTMKHLPSVLSRGSFESIKKAIQNMKDTGSWDPKCEDASKALETANYHHIWWYDDLCDLLVQEGISFTMKHLPSVVSRGSFESIKKAIQNMKDTGSWDPKCEDASKALETAYHHIWWYDDLCDLLFQEGISFTMKHLPSVVSGGSFKFIKKAIQNMKDTGNWDPDGDDAFKALENSFSEKKYDVCDLLVQEGISLTVKNLSSVVSSTSFTYIKKAIQNMKDTGNWDPDGDDALKALENSFSEKRYYVCDLLVQNGISFRMKHLPCLVSSGSFEAIKKAIQNMKDTGNWNPNGGDAFKALENSFTKKRYIACDLLFQEGISLTMKNLSSVVSSASYKYVKRTIQHLIETENWNPDCDDASEALENAYKHRKYDVCDLLIQERVFFTTKNHPLPVYSINFLPNEIAIQNIIYIDHCIHCIRCRVTQNTPVLNSKLPKAVVFHCIE